MSTLPAEATLPVTEDDAVLSTSMRNVKLRRTPLPMDQMAVLTMILLTESLCAMMLLPFVGLFVSHMMGWAPETAGYLSGVLVGSFMLGQVLSGKLWGYVSDNYGRKIPLATGLLVGAAMMIVFGVSPNFYVACIARLAHGFFNGTLLIAKTILSDITDSTNEAKGFAIVSLTWGVGALAGSTIGGFLYDPAHNAKLSWLHVSEGSFVDKNPAFLPCSIIAAYLLATWIATLVVLKETNLAAKSLWLILPSCCRPAGRVNASETVKAIPSDGAVLGDLSSSPTADLLPVTTCSDPPTLSITEGRKSKLTYMDAFRRPPSRYIIIIFMVFCASELAYSEIFSLWAIASPSVGGLGILSDKVAILILLYGAPSVLASLCFHKMCSLFPCKMVMWRVSIAIYAIPTIVIPCGGLMKGNTGYWYTLVLGLVRQVGLSWCFGLNSMLIPKVSPPGHVGAMFGINQAAAALMRCITPFAAAPLFAWSISSKNHHFPYNHFLVFLLSALLALATIVLSYYVDLPIEGKLSEPTESVEGHEPIQLINTEV